MNLLAEIIAFLILTLIGYSLGTLAEWIYNHIKEKWSKKYTPVMLSPGQIMIPGAYADNYKEHIKLHERLLNEQIQTFKAPRIRARTNKASKKRTKKSKSNNSKSRKGSRLQSK